MAKRTLSFRDWLKLVRKHALDDGFHNLGGHSIADVAERLDVSESRIYQLIDQDVLDTIAVTQGKRVAITMVTDASLERYLSERTPDRNRQGYFAFAK